jgi:nucleoside-diphosphate-sugar epimerase
VVTGASGNVGTALLRQLPADWTVTAVARRVPSGAPYDRASWLPCDLGAANAPWALADAMARADAVVHLAWSISPARTDPPMRRTNTDGTRHVLRAAVDAGVAHVVCASSVAAYRPPPRWDLVTEGWPCDGVAGSAYALGKAELERTLDRCTADHAGIVLTRIRPCAIVQRDAAGEFARWLLSPMLPERLLGRLPLPFWRGLRAQLVHADDVARAIRAVLEQRAGGAFNLASEQVLGARELAAHIGGPLVPVQRRLLTAGAWLTWRLGLQPTHPGWLRLADRAALVDTGRARAELSWRPEYDSAAALTDLLVGMHTRAGTTSAPLAPRDPGDSRDQLSLGRPSHQAQ